MSFPSRRNRQRIKNFAARIDYWATALMRSENYEEEKVFCVGRNKTGTTSMSIALAELGYRVAPQRYAELLADDFYLNGEFDPIIKYCSYFSAFQDIPFSWPNTYQVMDRAFPNARFILTVRDSPEQWYQSLVRFQSRRFGADGRLPTLEDLRSAEYVRPGFVYRNKSVWADELQRNPYDREVLIRSYNDYVSELERHFSGRDDKFLTINVSNPQDYVRLCDFLGHDPVREDGFPWENRT